MRNGRCGDDPDLLFDKSFSAFYMTEILPGTLAAFLDLMRQASAVVKQEGIFFSTLSFESSGKAHVVDARR